MNATEANAIAQAAREAVWQENWAIWEEEIGRAATGRKMTATLQCNSEYFNDCKELFFEKLEALGYEVFESKYGYNLIVEWKTPTPMPDHDRLFQVP